jgi:nucleoside-diphosphate-sugar epimerase
MIAVTGASGFLGGAVVKQLKTQGYYVRGLLRRPAIEMKDGQTLDEVVVGDITDACAAEKLVTDADVIIHTVSNFRALDDPPEAYWRVNVEGTRNLLNAALKAGVRRFVHCSTIGVHGDVAKGPGDESCPYNPGDLYQKTKLEAELLCQHFQKESDMDIVIVRPCSLFGPGDQRLLKIFSMAAKRRFVLIGDGKSKFHSLYIDDAAKAFVRAATLPGAANQIFIIGQPAAVELREYMSAVAASLGKETPFLKLPYLPIYLLAYASEKVLGIIGITSPLTVRRLRFFRNNRDFNVTKAKELLGFEAEVGLEEGLCRTANAYRDAGWI